MHGRNDTGHMHAREEEWMLTLVTCMVTRGVVDVDTGHMREEWMLTLVTCTGGVDVDTGHMHWRSGC